MRTGECRFQWITLNGVFNVCKLSVKTADEYLADARANYEHRQKEQSEYEMRIRDDSSRSLENEINENIELHMKSANYDERG